MVEVFSKNRKVTLGPGQPTVIIGERINPTGKPQLQEKIRKGDLFFLPELVGAQEKAWADMIGVNVGLPGTAEKELLCQAVEAVSRISDRPLYLDSSLPEALIVAWENYPYKPLVGSCTGEDRSYKMLMERFLPRPPALVVMLHDEQGIAKQAKDRLRVAEKVLNQAVQMGYPVDSLVFDCLAMTVGADPLAGKECLDCIRELAGQGLPTLIGLSNISFGMPERTLFNKVFAAMAVKAGVAGLILNPNSPELVAAVKAADVLSNRDPYATLFLEYYRSQMISG
jgi:5-methyltetrahydrofolate--homocysteine methyltransferase